MLVGPAHYGDSMAHPLWSGLSAYVREAERIRSTLRNMLFLGEILEPQEVRIAGDFTSHPHARWTVFRDPQRGRRAAVLVNLGATRSVVRWGGFRGRERGEVEIHQPFAEARRAEAPFSLTIPAERFAVVGEL
jgi:hypothetical protein